MTKAFQVTVTATGMLTRTVEVLADDEEMAKQIALIRVAAQDEWILRALDGDSVEAEHVEPKK